MSKTDVINALIIKGIGEFSRRGYEGASLRDIAEQAGVPLSAIHRYFGSKEDLYRAVEQRVWEDINIERGERLHQALADDPPRIDAIMRALIEPTVQRVLGHDVDARHTVEMLRSTWQARHYFSPSGPHQNRFRSISERWLRAIQAAFPDMPRNRLVWSFSFAVGALYSWQLLDHIYDEFLPPEQELAAQEVTDLLVDFCSAGFAAVARR